MDCLTVMNIPLLAVAHCDDDILPLILRVTKKDCNDESGNNNDDTSSRQEEELLPIAFFPLIVVQFWILVRFRCSLTTLPVLYSVASFMLTSVLYRQILSESPLPRRMAIEDCWLFQAFLLLLPELSIFATVMMATVTFHAILAYQTLLVSTIIMASIGLVLTIVQLWQVCCDDVAVSSDSMDDSKISDDDATEYVLIANC